MTPHKKVKITDDYPERMRAALDYCVARRIPHTNVVREYPPQGVTSDGRWFPKPSEAKDCCAVVKEPTARFKWTLYRHCCSYAHIAALWMVDEKELAREFRDYCRANQLTSVTGTTPTHNPVPTGSTVPF